MTLREFDEDITLFYELKDFCEREGCSYLDEYFDDLDAEVNSELYEWIRYNDCDWEDVRDSLSNITTGYDFYRRDGSFDYMGCDDEDFDTLKSDVREWAIENGRFDDDEDDDEDDGEEEEYRPALAPGFEYIDGETVFVGEAESVDTSAFDALVAV